MAPNGRKQITESLGFHSCSSALNQRKAPARCRGGGQGACFSPGGRAGRQAARQGTERRVPGRAGLQDGRGAAAVRQGDQHPPRPWERTRASAIPTWPRYPPQEAAHRRRRRGAWRAEARLRPPSPPGRGPPGAARGRWKPRAAPPQPHPTPPHPQLPARVATRHGLRPHRAGGG